MALDVGTILAVLRLDDQMSPALMNAQMNLQSTAAGITTIGMGLTAALTVPLAGIGIGATKAAMDFETAFTGVTKTVENAIDEFGGLTAAGRALEAGFRQMATEIPVTAVELARVGQAAGQLGIQTEHILGFTRVMADLGVTTNLSSDQAATALARLANITQMPQGQFDRLASSIVGLGNNFATTEAEIVEFGLRIAAAGQLAGLSEADILAIGTALSSLGVEAEAGGTAVQKVLLTMTQAVATTNADLLVFAQTAGMSAKDFATAFETDAMGAFNAFVTGLGVAGDDAFTILGNLDLQDQRLMRSFLALAGSGDLLTNAIRVSNTAWTENTAATREAERFYATTANELKLLWNQLVEVGIELGGALTPFIRAAIAAMQDWIPMIRGVATWFAELPVPMQATILATAGFAAALGPLLIVVGQFAMGLSTLIPLLSATGLAAGVTAGAVALLTSPFTLLGAAVAGLILITYELTGSWEGVWNAARTGLPLLTLLEGAYNKSAAAVAFLTPLLRDAWAILSDLGTIISTVVLGTIGDLAVIIGGVLSDEFTAIWGLISSVAETLAGPFLTAFGWVYDKVLAVLGPLGEFVSWLGQLAAATPSPTSALQGIATEVHAFADAITEDALPAINDLDTRGYKPWVEAQSLASLSLDQLNQAFAPNIEKLRVMQVETEEARKAAETYAKEIATLRAELSGAALEGDLRKLEAAWRGLTPAQQADEQTILRLQTAYGALRAHLTPNQLPADLEAVYFASIHVTQGIGELLKVTPFLGEAFANIERQARVAIPAMDQFGRIAGNVLPPEIDASKKAIDDWILSLEELSPELEAAEEAGTSWKDAVQTTADSIGKVLHGTAAAIFDLAKIWAQAIDAMITKFAEGDLVGGIVALGTAIVLTIGKILGLGPSAAEQAAKMREAWLASVDDLDLLTQQVELAGFSIEKVFDARSPKAFEAAVREVNVAIEAWEERVKNISAAGAGLTLMVDGMAQIIGQQTEATDASRDAFERMGASAIAVFGALLKETGSVTQAFAAISPALDQLIALQDQFGFAATNSVQALLDIRQVITANADVMQSIDGLTQLMGGLTKAGQVSAGMFAGFAQDAAFLFQTLVDRGVEADQAMALMQPTLQDLWEAQQKFGFVTDETTQALIDQAVEQGLVGDQMRDVNEQILAVLLRMETMFSQTLPAALQTFAREGVAAANDVETAVDEITYGSSPGGLVDVITRVGEAGAAFTGFGSVAVSASDTVSSAVKDRLTKSVTDLTGYVSTSAADGWRTFGSIGAGESGRIWTALVGADGITRAVMTVDAILDQVDWAGFAAEGVAAAQEIEAAIDAVTYGSSPGGIVDLIAETARLKYDLLHAADEMVDALDGVKDAADRVGEGYRELGRVAVGVSREAEMAAIAHRIAELEAALATAEAAGELRLVEDLTMDIEAARARLGALERGERPSAGGGGRPGGAGAGAPAVSPEVFAVLERSLADLVAISGQLGAAAVTRSDQYAVVAVEMEHALNAVMAIGQMLPAAQQGMLAGILGLAQQYQAFAVPGGPHLRDLAAISAEMQAAIPLLLAALPHFAEGGIVPRDTLAILHGQEAILNRRATALVGPAGIEALNRGELPSFAGVEQRLDRLERALLAQADQDRRWLSTMLPKAIKHAVQTSR